MGKKSTIFNRANFIKKLDSIKIWDIIIIGGGATGLGIALDAADRGLTTLLLEQNDFAKGTSSRSTKLIHGGVRYLASGNLKLVYSALRERGFLLKNAPHLVKRQSFIIPCYRIADVIKYMFGLTFYDMLSGSYSLGRSRYLKKSLLTELLPGINNKGLIGGIEYFDCKFDDARFAINIAQTAAEKGSVVLNYFKVNGLIKNNNKISGVLATDFENGKGYQLMGKVVINATGVFVDDILQMDNPGKNNIVLPSQGVHIILSKHFLKSDSALMIPKTSDGRVLFAIPWNNYVLIGTTDTPVDNKLLEPIAIEEEVNFILDGVKKYLTIIPVKDDILSIFAGLRPLAASGNGNGKSKEISRDHKLIVSKSDLITITGGKWTTYRKMAEETINKVIEISSFTTSPCTTKNVHIHGFLKADSKTHLSIYGSDEQNIRALIKESPSLNNQLINNFPYTEAEVIWAVRNEMARTVEDVLARRLRLLFINARAAMNAAPRVAKLIALELGYDEHWEITQVNEFVVLANHYLCKSLVT